MVRQNTNFLPFLLLESLSLVNQNPVCRPTKSTRPGHPDPTDMAPAACPRRSGRPPNCAAARRLPRRRLWTTPASCRGLAWFGNSRVDRA